MSVEEEPNDAPVVEMVDVRDVSDAQRLALAPMETIDMIESAENGLPDPTQESKPTDPLVKEL